MNKNAWIRLLKNTWISLTENAWISLTENQWSVWIRICIKVEECRLSSGERLIRYLTVMSIIAWRIFFITLISRSDPNLPCTTLLEEEEWKVLYVKINKAPLDPEMPPPTIKEAIMSISIEN